MPRVLEVVGRATCFSLACVIVAFRWTSIQRLMTKTSAYTKPCSGRGVQLELGVVGLGRGLREDIFEFGGLERPLLWLLTHDCSIQSWRCCLTIFQKRKAQVKAGECRRVAVRTGAATAVQATRSAETHSDSSQDRPT